MVAVTHTRPNSRPEGATAVLVLADGTLVWGYGAGAEGESVGEICFNTAMTGYQEILTDPSYAGQVITFTFPHVGNVGTNSEDIETAETQNPAARGFILRENITEPASFRARNHFSDWAKKCGMVGITGVDTRRLTRHIRRKGAPNGVIAHNKNGKFDIAALLGRAREWPGLLGMDLAKEVSTRQSYTWDEGLWSLGKGFAPGVTNGTQNGNARFHVVAVDYGIKRNILRCLVDIGARVTVVPCDATAEDILAHKPDGVFLSNGPGDPAATGEYAIPVLQDLIASGTPLFGICLGHQLLALAMGAKTIKMHQGHRGANHPVKDLTTGKVEITSMNHGFAVEKDNLPDGLTMSHVSLFDGSLCGLEVAGKPIFSVQYHPEASPGPMDSNYLFNRFAKLMEGV